MNRFASLLLTFLTLTACGARTGLRTPDVELPDVVRIDVPDVPTLDVADVTDAPDVRDVQMRDIPNCTPVSDNCGGIETCGNGADDNCNGQVDEGCACEPGMVQACFLGPPGRRNIGVCQDGSQVCGMATGTWGPCTGGISPREDECNGTDNLCTGCSAQRDCPIMCPGPDDPRTPDAVPLQNYPLRGRDFYTGAVMRWQWSVQGGPCDALVAGQASFQLLGANMENASLLPRLSGDYTITLAITTPAGTVLRCTWIVTAVGPGLRVELCYPENTTIDLDLYLHRSGSTAAWFPTGEVFQPSPDVCGWHNCEAQIRGMTPGGAMVPRANWGYPTSNVANCLNGPEGAIWGTLGFCNNPRLDIDNNLEPGRIGLPENINIDNPRNNETFRVMVQHFTGGAPANASRPLLNVYCSGKRVATLGSAPDTLRNFTGVSSNSSPTGRMGAMWRVADITTTLTADGRTQCVVRPLHPPGQTTGYFITQDVGTF